MASGDSLLFVPAETRQGPATSFATLEELAGGSSPAESYARLAFDSDTVGTIEYADFHLVLPNHYGGNGLDIEIVSAGELTTNVYAWDIALRSKKDDADDLSASHTYDFNKTADITPPNVVGELTYDTLSFTDGADMDNVLKNEGFVLRIRRAQAVGTEMAGDAYLHWLHIRES